MKKIYSTVLISCIFLAFLFSFLVIKLKSKPKLTVTQPSVGATMHGFLSSSGGKITGVLFKSDSVVSKENLCPNSLYFKTQGNQKFSVVMKDSDGRYRTQTTSDFLNKTVEITYAGNTPNTQCSESICECEKKIKADLIRAL